MVMKKYSIELIYTALFLFFGFVFSFVEVTLSHVVLHFVLLLLLELITYYGDIRPLRRVVQINREITDDDYGAREYIKDVEESYNSICDMRRRVWIMVFCHVLIVFPVFAVFVGGYAEKALSSILAAFSMFFVCFIEATFLYEKVTLSFWQNRVNERKIEIENVLNGKGVFCSWGNDQMLKSLPFMLGFSLKHNLPTTFIFPTSMDLEEFICRNKNTILRYLSKGLHISLIAPSFTLKHQGQTVLDELLTNSGGRLTLQTDEKRELIRRSWMNVRKCLLLIGDDYLCTFGCYFEVITCSLMSFKGERVNHVKDIRSMISEMTDKGK